MKFNANEILGPPSGWIINSGISAVGLFLLIVILGAAWIPYNRKLTGDFNLKTSPGLLIVEAKKSGAVYEVFKSEGDEVVIGDTIIIIENKEFSQPLMRLNYWLQKNGSPDKNNIHTLKIPDGNYPTQIQQYVAALKTHQRSIIDLNQFRSINSTITSINKEIANTNQLISSIKLQYEISQQEIDVRKALLSRDEKLNSQGVLSDKDYESSSLIGFNSGRQHEALKAREYEALIRIEQLNQKKEKIIMEHRQLKNSHFLEYSNTIYALKGGLSTYYLESIIIAKAAGKWSWAGKKFRNNDFIQVGSPIGFVIPSGNNLRITAEIKCPQINSGEVRPGTIVLLEFDAHPEAQHGQIEANVSSILPDVENSTLTTSFRQVTAELNQPLVTNYGFNIPFEYNLSGKAKFILEQKSILNWFITETLNIN